MKSVAQISLADGQRLRTIYTESVMINRSVTEPCTTYETINYRWAVRFYRKSEFHVLLREVSTELLQMTDGWVS